MPVGDVASQERGSGARYNDAKPDLSLVPLRLILPAVPPAWRWRLSLLAAFQETSDSAHLDQLLACATPQDWADCARVFEYGRRKYAAWNWAKGMKWSIPLACAARHVLLGPAVGQQNDAESGLPHSGHFLCNVVMLAVFVRSYREGNDLPPPGLLA